MNVVIYARYSSDKQGENTIEAQLRYCTEYCERNNHKIITQYIDRATTASKDVEKRFEFQKMIRDSDKHLFDAIVVFKLDRFARNRYDSATYKNRLKKNGVQVLSATENLSGEKESIILEAVLEGMAEYFSKDLAEKVTSGMREVAMKCQTNGGLTPLGYKVVDKKLVLDPDTAPIVKEAFIRYANDERVSDIIEDFNRRGFRSARGCPFNKNSFHNMFINEKYVGIYKFQDIRIENGIPAIIDKETFQKVQLKMKTTKTKLNGKNKATTEYLLSCKIICGECGSNLCGESGHSRNGTIYYYYKCSNQKKNHACDLKPISKDIIEKKVIDETIKVLTPEIIDKIADLTMKAVEDEKQKNKIIPDIKKQLKEIDTKINNLLKALESYQSPTIVERLKELEENKKSLTKELEIECKNKLNVTKDMILFYFDRLLSGDLDDLSTQKRLVDILVEKVTVFNNEDIDIKFNFDTVGFP